MPSDSDVDLQFQGEYYGQLAAERALIEKYWTPDCTSKLRDLVRKHARFFTWHVTDAFRESIGEERWQEFNAEVDVSRKRGRICHASINIPMYYGELKAHELDLVIEELATLNCLICGHIQNLNKLKPGIVKYFDSPFILEEYPLCQDCLDSALWRPPRGMYGRHQLLSRLSALVEAMGFIPPQAYRRNPLLIKRIQLERLPHVLSALVNMPSVKEYKKQFGSWLKALIAGGFLDDGCRSTGRGTMCVANDGHDCLSLAEKFIDDWLFSNGIAHEKEPNYPQDERLNPNGNLRGDWKVGSTLIEYFGLLGEKEYDERVCVKRSLAAKHGINLIEICPDDLGRLSTLLGHLASSEPAS